MSLFRTRSFSLRRLPSRLSPVPAPLRRLDLLCPDRHAHQLLLRLRCAGPTVTRLGYVAANFVCPFKGCRHKQVWGIDRITGRPACLWSGKVVQPLKHTVKVAAPFVALRLAEIEPVIVRRKHRSHSPGPVVP